jgi:hypothetical protein
VVLGVNVVFGVLPAPPSPNISVIFAWPLPNMCEFLPLPSMCGFRAYITNQNIPFRKFSTQHFTETMGAHLPEARIGNGVNVELEVNLRGWNLQGK